MKDKNGKRIRVGSAVSFSVDGIIHNMTVTSTDNTSYNKSISMESDEGTFILDQFGVDHYNLVVVPKPKGFAALSKEQRKIIATNGGIAAQKKNNCNRFNSETGAAAGRLGAAARWKNKTASQ